MMVHSMVVPDDAKSVLVVASSNTNVPILSDISSRVITPQMDLIMYTSESLLLHFAMTQHLTHLQTPFATDKSLANLLTALV